MQLYWCSAFILPNAIIKDIEKLLQGYLWCQGELKCGKAKVKWDDVCLPKEEGGLSIKRLRHWNVALMTSHIWRLSIFKDSFWVRWIHEYKLKRYSFWDVPITAGLSWCWRKILRIRPLVKQYFVYKIGNGQNVSAWFDSWSSIGTIVDIIPTNEIQSLGFTMKETVCDLANGTSWPTGWLQVYPSLNSINIPLLSNHEDKLCWKDSDNRLMDCSVSRIWDTIRPRVAVVPWFRVV
ncbi:uncharacterized mitochondrial protein AtMg00310-like [Rutidosis leptorrhynchoides]|uniref:uncharacterized mitochondrial protein AtMg00310-like n=1 Tax=Rutidosis leptorrhynchoides TaxID=125765 RepID=UPI003A993C8E